MTDTTKMVGCMIVTPDDWVVDKNGVPFRQVWGKCEVVRAKDIFGFEPKAGTNWYLKIGDKDEPLFIAGCKIHFTQSCSNEPLHTGILKIR